MAAFISDGYGYIGSWVAYLPAKAEKDKVPPH